MSIQNLVYGRLEKISPTKNETLEQYAKNILKGALLCKSKWADEKGYKKNVEPESYIPYLLKELGDEYGYECKYNIIKGSLYKIFILHEDIPSGINGDNFYCSIHTLNEDIYFVTSFYDGGMCLDEAIVKSFMNPSTSEK